MQSAYRSRLEVKDDCAESMFHSRNIGNFILFPRTWLSLTVSDWKEHVGWVIARDWRWSGSGPAEGLESQKG